MSDGLRILSDPYSEIANFIISIRKYEIKKRIGVGGYSEVYKAIKKSTGEEVSFKQFTNEITKKDARLIRREIMTLSSVSHPFLLHFIGFSPKVPVTIVTEYVPNGQLFRMLHNKKYAQYLDGNQLTLIAMGIAHALNYLHKKGIIHRDLKSTNILIDDNYLPRIVDFGIARFVNDKAPMTENLGPLQWMAPEVLEGSDYGYPADVYSYGVILYEMCSMNIPWNEMETEEIQSAVLKGKRPKIPKNAPESIRSLIRKCWQDNPNDRPTFSKIYSMFAGGKCSFEGTDSRQVADLDRKLLKFKEPQKSKTLTKEKNTSEDEFAGTANKIRQRMYSSDRQVNIKPARREDAVGGFVDIEAIKNTRDYLFRPELKKATTELPKVQSRAFFSAIQQHFKKPPRSAEFDAILRSVQKIIQKRCHLNTFIQLGLHKQLPFDRSEFVTQSLDILLIIAMKIPSELLGFSDVFKKISETYPARAVVLFAYTSKVLIDTELEQTLFDCCVFLEQTPAAPELISLLFSLCESDKSFERRRRSDICMVLNKALNASKAGAVYSLYALSSIYKPSIEIDFGAVSRLLTDKETADAALCFLVKVKEPPVLPSLINSLIRCSKGSEIATLCLLRIAAVEDGARALLREPTWVGKRCPTIYGTLKLILACMIHEPLRKIVGRVPGIPWLLGTLIAESDSRSLIYVSSIVRRFEVDSEILQRLREEGVIKASIQEALELEDTPEVLAVLSMVHEIAKVGFLPEYVLLADRLKQIIVDGSDLVPVAIAVITELSRYPLCAKKFKDLKLDKFFIKLKEDPEFERYANRFLKNVKVTNFY